jgi:centromeric protein E
MEARKSRLHTQLAKLNTQVLTSELPRAGSGIPSLPAGPKRRRISDLYSVMGASRVGLGSPKQKALDTRRAVSSALRMPQVPEDEMPAIHSQLDQPPPKVCRTW